MNIFVTNSCPKLSARYLDNKRVIKMALESTQMLCSALNLAGGTTPYKTAHKNHPCSIWARQSRANWLWLYDHAIALCNEYTLRYGKIHKCESILNNINTLVELLPIGQLTPFVNCTTHKNISNVFIAYQLELNDKWDKDKISPKWS